MKRFLVCALLVVAGCSRVEPDPQQIPVNPEQQSGRMLVVSAQSIVTTRGISQDIIVLKDTVTGYEYLAVMGAGVTEMVQKCVTTGKTLVCTREDE